MASISNHLNKYRVRVRRKGFPTISKCFRRHCDAKEWPWMMETKADGQELAPDSKPLKSIALGDPKDRFNPGPDSTAPWSGSSETGRFADSLCCRRAGC